MLKDLGFGKGTKSVSYLLFHFYEYMRYKSFYFIYYLLKILL